MITQFSQVLNTQKLCVGAGIFPALFVYAGACQRAVKTRRQRVFSVFSRPGITFAEILRAGTETRPYKKQLRPMSGGPSCFYYEVKATICCAPVRTAIRCARRPASVPQIEASRFRPLKGKHISRYLREFGARRCVPTHGEYVQKES